MEAIDTENNITAFGEDESGELYVVAMSGEILRIAPTPPVVTPPPCDSGQRPRITVRSNRIDARLLQVTASVSTNSRTPVNELRSIGFTRFDNARVTIGTQVDRDTPFSVSLPANSQTTQFTVSRKELGLQMTVRFNVVDVCGPWSTFAGDGGRVP